MINMPFMLDIVIHPRAMMVLFKARTVRDGIYKQFAHLAAAGNLSSTPVRGKRSAAIPRARRPLGRSSLKSAWNCRRIPSGTTFKVARRTESALPVRRELHRGRGTCRGFGRKLISFATDCARKWRKDGGREGFEEE